MPRFESLSSPARIADAISWGGIKAAEPILITRLDDDGRIFILQSEKTKEAALAAVITLNAHEVTNGREPNYLTMAKDDLHILAKMEFEHLLETTQLNYPHIY